MRAKNAEGNTAKNQVSTLPLQENDLGDVRIHENVIATLARRSALSIEGVSRMAGNALIDNIAEIVGSRRMQSRSVTIENNAKGELKIGVKVVLRSGYSVPETAEKIQKAVSSSIESVTGMTVLTVQVLVQEIDDPEPGAPAVPAEEKKENSCD